MIKYPPVPVPGKELNLSKVKTLKGSIFGGNEVVDYIANALVERADAESGNSTDGIFVVELKISSGLPYSDRGFEFELKYRTSSNPYFSGRQAAERLVFQG